MALRDYTVTGAQAAYGKDPGGVVTLDAADPLVQMNIAAGVLSIVPDQPPLKLICPACAERIKRPPHFSSSEELAAHYSEKHPALVAPANPEGVN